jgi:hypothetical protein
VGEFATPCATMHVVRDLRGETNPKVPEIAWLTIVENGFTTGTLLCDPGGITKSPFVTNFKGALQ